MIFWCYYFKSWFNFYPSGRYIFLMYFFKMTPSGFLKRFLFIKGFIPTNLDMMKSLNVYPERFGDFIVSYKYCLLTRRIQFGSLLFRNIHIYWTTKYLEMAHFRFLSYIHLFRSLESKSTVSNLLCTYTTILGALDHKWMERSWWWIIFSTTSIVVLLFLFTTPFRWGL